MMSDAPKAEESTPRSDESVAADIYHLAGGLGWWVKQIHQMRYLIVYSRDLAELEKYLREWAGDGTPSIEAALRRMEVAAEQLAMISKFSRWAIQHRKFQANPISENDNAGESDIRDGYDRLRGTDEGDAGQDCPGGA